jgi:hypothetical protein
LGRHLFDTLFQGELRSYLRQSQDEVARQSARGLRIRLLLTDVPELASIPWEYLYDSAHDQYLGLSTQTPVVRSLDLARRIQPLTTEAPLRILTMISAPSDQAPLDVETEWVKLREALAQLEEERRIVLERLEQATLPSLQQKLRRGSFHIFHYMGHGVFDRGAQDGMLILENDQGYSHPVSSRILGTLLHDEPLLRLAVLNACEGAQGSRDNPFAGTAQTLLRKGIPAIVAMRTPITDEAAKTFAHEFYLAVADDYPVEAALTEARKAIYRLGNEQGLAVHAEWGTPVLYMHASDGALWQIGSGEEESETMNEEQPWWEGISIQSEGDVIIGYAGTGAQHTTIGKEITIVLGEPQPDDTERIDTAFSEAEAALARLHGDLDPQLATMAAFQLRLLRGELDKADEGSAPSANTITQVGDWLLTSVPGMSKILQRLFASPAVGRVLAQAGDEAVAWIQERFGG